jgi:hypothetical protein
MSKRVQLLGHVAELAATFVGLIRELTVDTDNAELRLHDGVTEGGRRFLDRDANDNRYQLRSVELDGLLGWEPQERGFTVRLGPSNYRLRSITVDGGSLTIQNANGHDGNPLIAFAPEITTDHSWTGAHSFDQAIAAMGGVIGNLVGNTAGTHTGDVVGNVTGNLTGNANGNHTGTFVGDADFSGHGVLFADEQILLAWLEPAILDYVASKGVPVGTIVAYGGAVLDIPANWFLCDGTNGTPDLRDRFIVCAGPTYPPDDFGGAANHSHVVTIDSGGAHSHTGNVGDTALTIAQMPAHNHGNGVNDVGTDLWSYGSKAAPASPDSIDNNGSSGTNQGLTETIGGGATHTHTLALDAGGAHTHTGSTANASSLPPYYSLMYIMKGA